MTPEEAIAQSYKIVEGTSYSVKELSPENFLRYSANVAYLVKQKSKAWKAANQDWLRSWAEVWRRLHGEFDTLYRRDPMLVYRPKNSAAESFHRSPAFIRYFRGGNRTSKTQTGYAEHYYITTGQHKWRRFPPAPHSTFIVTGLTFTDYVPKTYLKKMLLGEPGNIVSPMFPVGGKWFYHYDARTYTITIACPECAHAGKAQRCPGHHQKSTISLVSAEKGVGAIESFSATIGHGDEHLPREFLHAMTMRVADRAPFNGLMFTGTPLHGMDSWETSELAAVALGDPTKNHADPSDPTSPPYVSMHQISQWDAGVVSHAQIRMQAARMDEFELRARVLGEPAPMAKNPVFPKEALSKMREKVKNATRYSLKPANDRAISSCFEPEHIEASIDSNGGLRVWEAYQPSNKYLLCVDSAAGLTDRDPSCATMLKATPKPMGGFKLTQVAQLHVWINPLEYAEEVYKMGVMYGFCPVAIELTGGLGRAVMLKMKEMGYWNLFADQSKPENIVQGDVVKLGVDTTSSSKPAMIAALHQLIKQGDLELFCEETILELSGYEQERTESGNSMKYRGAGGMHDDRVMALAIGAFIAVAFPNYLLYSNGAITRTAKAGKYIDPEWGDVWGKLNSRLNEEVDPFL